MDIAAIQARLRTFAAERDWDQYHTPKNLTTALVCEAAELAEIFQWMTPAESEQCMVNAKTAAEIKEELADVFIYCLRLADRLKVDLAIAVNDKIEANARSTRLKRRVETR